jgi:hypothetical protein
MLFLRVFSLSLIADILSLYELPCDKFEEFLLSSLRIESNLLSFAALLIDPELGVF